jgi:ATP-dependent Clp protease ATP-binding subunit ClpC
MIPKYQEDTKRAINRSITEAWVAKSDYICPEHIFLGLTKNPKVNSLFHLSDQTDNFRRVLDLPLEITEQAPPATEIPLSNASKRVLAYAAEETVRVGSMTIGPEHLLLALLRENDSRVPSLLAAAGLNLLIARNRVREELGLPLLKSEHQPPML